MRRVMIVCEYPSLNGGEQSLLAVLREARQSARSDELRFLVAAPATGPLAAELHRQRVPLVPFQPGDASGIRRERMDVLRDLRRIIDHERPDLVHANSLSMSRLLGMIAAETAVPCTGHLRDILRLNRSTIRDMNQLSAIVAVSEATRRFHIAQGLDENLCRAIPNGIDANQFHPAQPRVGLRKQLGIDEQAIVLGTVGQIGLRKAQDRIPRLLDRLVQSGEDIHWLLVGQRHSRKAESVEFEYRIRADVRQTRLENRLHWLGTRTDMPGVFAELDLVVHLARQEPFGRVLLEAAAMERPIVATDVGGTSEMLRPGREAVLVASDDDESLVDGVLKLIRDRAESARLAAAARERVVKEFSIRDSARKLTTFWKDLIPDRTGPG